jgi:outer membrane receptor protein involved in Fe transport
MFNSQLYILSQHNSSRLAEGPLGGDGYDPRLFDPETGKAVVQIEDMIDVQPGDRLPGVPLHNVNATLTVNPTEKWDLSLNMVAHSSSFMRGNENNDHRAGTLIYIDEEFPGAPTEIREVYRFDGEVPGYALFNLKTSYEVGKGFTLFGQVNNLLDKAYFSAGRLGVNPFAPSTEGAIGPSGWNYNSLEWVKSSFVAPGSPRAYWMGLEYQF